MKVKLFSLLSIVLLCVFLLLGCDESYVYLSTKPTEEQAIPNLTEIINGNEGSSIVPSTEDITINKDTAEKDVIFDYLTCVITGFSSYDSVYVYCDEEYAEILGYVAIVKMDGIKSLGLGVDEYIKVRVKKIENSSPCVIYASEIITINDNTLTN